MAEIDYYEILEIHRSASSEEIKRSYKRLAFEYHPDRNPGNSGAEDKFKVINEAYQILSDPDKRAHYDSFGHISSEGLFTDQDFESDFSDIFGNLFEEVFNAGQRQRAERGSDLKYKLELTFEEALDGVEKEIKVPRRVLCSGCRGSGAAKGGEAPCRTCGGRGELRYSQGFIAIKRQCSTCGGSGIRITKACGQCGGHKFSLIENTVKVKVPRGITDGARLRIRGEGDSGFNGGPEGDLYIEIKVHEHPLFRREGHDLFLNVPVGFTQAALGDEVEIITPKGRSTIKIPAGTQSGQTFRLKGKGAPRLEGRGTGDLYIQIEVRVPVHLSRKQKQILKDFEKASEEKNLPNVKRFLDKLHRLFK
ncbi:MAG: molecular chaperone DnaJ [Pirellulales bacterium]|nr:molecular chaperone DnaJ [Pirellulales bacterium]